MSCTPSGHDYSAFPYAERIDSFVMAAVDSNMIPGAVVCIIKEDNIAYLKAYGYRQVWPDTLPMTVDTQFDLASLSKVVGTGMAIMHLVEECKVDLDAPISKYLPEYQSYVDVENNVGREQKVVDFLTHTSGLPAYASYSYLLRDNIYASPKERRAILREYMATCQRRAPAGVDCEYSCLNFISLQYMLETVTGMTLDAYVSKYIWQPLGMNHTCYYPIGSGASNTYALENSPKWMQMENVAPTEKIPSWNGFDVVPSILYADVLRQADSIKFCADSAQDEHEITKEYIESHIPKYKPCYEAIVHDPLAREMNAGVSGNAGVFSTAEDLAKMAIWIMNPDKNKGPFSTETLNLMLSVPPGYEVHGRALAWDKSSDYAWLKGQFASSSAVCHTGYTGTSIVVDPVKRKAIIILTNRAHPDDNGGTAALRKGVADAVFGAE